MKTKLGEIMRAAAVALLCLGATPAFAQDPSGSAVATAKELIEIKGGGAMFEPVIPGIIEQAKNTFLPTNPGLAKELTEVANQLRTEFLPRRAQLMEEIAKLYAQRFSEAELKEIITFYKSPVGKKMATEEPAVLEQSFQLAQQWASRLSEEVLQQYRAEMKKRGHDL
jgi:hypothetical protein